MVDVLGMARGKGVGHSDGQINQRHKQAIGIRSRRSAIKMLVRRNAVNLDDADVPWHVPER